MAKLRQYLLVCCFLMLSSYGIAATKDSNPLSSYTGSWQVVNPVVPGYGLLNMEVTEAPTVYSKGVDSVTVKMKIGVLSDSKEYMTPTVTGSGLYYKREGVDNGPAMIVPFSLPVGDGGIWQGEAIFYFVNNQLNASWFARIPGTDNQKGIYDREVQLVKI